MKNEQVCEQVYALCKNVMKDYTIQDLERALSNQNALEAIRRLLGRIEELDLMATELAQENKKLKNRIVAVRETINGRTANHIVKTSPEQGQDLTMKKILSTDKFSKHRVSSKQLARLPLHITTGRERTTKRSLTTATPRPQTLYKQLIMKKFSSAHSPENRVFDFTSSMQEGANLCS